MHVARHVQLELQALLFLLLLDQLLDRSGHGVEGVGQRGELVARAHRDAPGKIGGVDALGALVQVGDRARHGARQAHADQQGEQLDHQERDGGRGQQGQREARIGEGEHIFSPDGPCVCGQPGTRAERVENHVKPFLQLYFLCFQSRADITLATVKTWCINSAIGPYPKQM